MGKLCGVQRQKCFTRGEKLDFFFLLQIKHMMAFIEQEANEKAEEIDAKVNWKYLFFLCVAFKQLILAFFDAQKLTSAKYLVCSFSVLETVLWGLYATTYLLTTKELTSKG